MRLIIVNHRPIGSAGVNDAPAADADLRDRGAHLKRRGLVAQDAWDTINAGVCGRACEVRVSVLPSPGALLPRPFGTLANVRQQLGILRELGGRDFTWKKQFEEVGARPSPP
jgi:hypothetical protein